jgi:ABC-type molybdate transport system ATPase subunit
VGQQVLEGLQRWTREHAVPALLVTHRLAESFLVGGEVVVLDNGAVMAQGNAAQVLRKERERLLAELDAPPSGPVFSADGR